MDKEDKQNVQNNSKKLKNTMSQRQDYANFSVRKSLMKKSNMKL